MARGGKSKGRKPSSQELRIRLAEIRKAASKLKAKGLISKSANLRKAIPSRAVQKRVALLEGVLRGEAVAVKRSRTVADYYRKAGFNVVGNFLLVDPLTAHQISPEEDQFLTYQRMTMGGTVERRIVLPASVKNLDTFLEGDWTKWPPDLSGTGFVYAFTFYGRNSLATFTSIELLKEYLAYYRALTDDPEEAWKELILYQVVEGSWHPSALVRRPKKTLQDRRMASGRVRVESMAEVYERQKKRQREKRENEDPMIGNARRAANRERMRLTRKAKKENPNGPARAPGRPRID